MAHILKEIEHFVGKEIYFLIFLAEKRIDVSHKNNSSLVSESYVDYQST